MTSVEGLTTSPQAAVMLGCSVRTVHRYVATRHLLPILSMSGPSGAFIFRTADVERLVLLRTPAA